MREGEEEGERGRRERGRERAALSRCRMLLVRPVISGPGPDRSRDPVFVPSHTQEASPVRPLLCPQTRRASGLDVKPPVLCSRAFKEREHLERSGLLLFKIAGLPGGLALSSLWKLICEWRRGGYGFQGCWGGGGGGVEGPC